MLFLENIKQVYKNTNELKGYYIEFEDGNKIHLTKRRTIIALLILIKYHTGTEADLAQGNSKIQIIRDILGDKIPTHFILDYYSDANKPYSELWNEEGFTFIDNLKGGRARLSQVYSLQPNDHHKLFQVTKKAYRKAPSNQQKQQIRYSQNDKCNFCGSNIMPKSQLQKHTYAKGRRRETLDHRHPVEKGGNSNIENFQGLCFYCNKCKWQICNICTLSNCDLTCALRYPESYNIIAPTGENISDVLADRGIFRRGR